MKKIAVFFVGIFCSSALFAAPGGGDFQIAAQFLNAARDGNVQTVERLVNSGADINYTDGTGLSIVCTAIMNNDLKAAQILQVYGADASKCDAQIRKYKSKLPKENSGGLFSGLSDVQNMTLAAGGAALVIGGAAALLGGFSGGDGGASGGGGTDGRPNTGGGGSGGGGAGTSAGTMPYSLPEWNVDTGKPKDFDLTGAMNLYSGGGAANANNDFGYMSGGGYQNYLLMTGGYAALARGYSGYVVPRNSSTRAPLPLDQGYGPVSVALITANGVNPTGTAADRPMTYLTPTCTEGTQCLQHAQTYKNLEDGQNAASFDSSGAGLAFNYADQGNSGKDTLLAKMIIGGSGDWHDAADFIGYMPNGRLWLYRTGGGKKFSERLGGAAIFDPDAKTITYSDGTVSQTIENARIGADGYIHAGDKIYGIQGDAAGAADLWEMAGQSYKNYELLKLAYESRIPVIANAALLPNMRGADVEDIDSIDVAGSQKNAAFLSLIEKYYYGSGANGDHADSLMPGIFMGGANSPLIVFSAGEYICDGYGANSCAMSKTREATFENAAPLLTAANGLNHHFLTAVAVQYSAGTANVVSASGEPASGKYQLANYSNTISGENFSARACGAAGLGAGAIDPWCFSSPGLTGEQAVATLAGAAGVLLGAFNYMNTEQIFMLMALTADGKYYGQSQLQERYALPADFQAGLNRMELTGDAHAAKWMEYFARAFGYGLVNLNRATTPNQQLWFYSSGRINSPDGNAYWSGTGEANRAATVFKPSSAFGARGAVISAPLFDFVASADGTESMPRVFENEFAFGRGARGLSLTSLMDELGLGAGEDGMASSPSPIARRNDGAAFGFDAIRNDGVGLSFGCRARAEARSFSAPDPVFGLAGRAFNSQFTIHNAQFSIFSGAITDEALLENDPTISGNFRPAELGNAYGFDSSVKLGAFKFGAGYMSEDKTVLGAQSGGLFDLGGGKTAFASAEFKFGAFAAKYTRAHTETNAGPGFVNDLSDLESDAYSLSADFGKWSFNISRPLAITRGHLEYVGADYELVESAGGYDLSAAPYLERLDLAPSARETRVAIAYRPQVSDSTQMALGFVGRINPDNGAGHEEILMLKLRAVW